MKIQNTFNQAGVACMSSPMSSPMSMSSSTPILTPISAPSQRRRNNKWLLGFAAAALFMALMFAMQISVQAAPQHGFGRDQGRTQPINVNDFHTNQWDRFHHNYHFTSGMNYRYDLGRPTTFDGFVPPNAHNVNFRRDANVSLRPPSHGVFSGNFPTDPSNRFFQQPVSPHFHRPFELENPNVISHFDTLQIGTNAQPTGHPANSHNVGTISPNRPTGGNNNGFLPPTSINDR